MKKKIKTLLKFGILVTLLASILPSILPNVWFIDILSNFKLQILLFLLVVFVINILTSKSISFIALVLVVWDASYLYSLYLPSRLGEIDKLGGTKITSINLLSSNNESEKVKSYIKNENPDILILLEFNPKWEALLSEITNQYAFKKTVVRNDNFGTGYFSKIESKTSILNFDDTQVPSIKANIKIGDKPLTIIATHPFPPVGQERFNARNFHLKSITKKRNEFAENLILVGDLNTSSFANHFKDLLEETKLKDSRQGLGLLPTWPSTNYAMQTTLDHFLVSDKVYVINRGTGPNLGSDHLPIFMEFRIKDQSSNFFGTLIDYF